MEMKRHTQPITSFDVITRLLSRVLSSGSSVYGCKLGTGIGLSACLLFGSRTVLSPFPFSVIAATMSGVRQEKAGLVVGNVLVI